MLALDSAPSLIEALFRCENAPPACCDKLDPLKHSLLPVMLHQGRRSLILYHECVRSFMSHGKERIPVCAL